MLALATSAGILLYLFLVFGVFFSKVFRIKPDPVNQLFLGLVAVNSISTIASLIVPVNIKLLAVILLTSIFLLLFIRKEIKAVMKSFIQDRTILFLFFPFIIYAFLISLGPPRNYDSGLYHIQTIKWIESYPVVPGLANLHSRFGFNSNVFTLFSLTSLSDLFGQEVFAVNFVIFSLLIYYFVKRLHSTFLRSSINNLFLFNLLIFISIITGTRFISSPDPDYIVINLIIYILSRLFESEEPLNEASIDWFFPLLIVTIYTITVKFTVLPLILAFLIIYIRLHIPFKKTIILAGLISVIILPWILRYIILTGWFIYPLSSIDLFNFDWKVPCTILENERLSIIGWARIPGEGWSKAAVMGIQEWVPIWWNNHTTIDHLKLIASFFFPVLTLALSFFRKAKLQFVQISALFTVIVCLAYWFIMAPDFRFGSGYVLMALLCPLIYLKFFVNTTWSPLFKPEYVMNIIVLLILLNFIIRNTGKGFVSGSVHRLLKPQEIEIPEGHSFTTYEKGGIKFSVPDGTNDQCFDICIPCTPYLNGNLELRNNSLEGGFRVRLKE
ncbi:MAG TPA: hypothetical protein VHO46_12845 [Bacteroidales bacterium]|nr:hypothetical protein [Bacteroidales bacterium]